MHGGNLLEVGVRVSLVDTKVDESWDDHEDRRDVQHFEADQVPLRVTGGFLRNFDRFRMFEFENQMDEQVGERQVDEGDHHDQVHEYPLGIQSVIILIYWRPCQVGLHVARYGT